jgi:hypothetical protein
MLIQLTVRRTAVLALCQITLLGGLCCLGPAVMQPLPVHESPQSPHSITTGPDGALWFALSGGGHSCMLGYSGLSTV